MDMAKKKYKRLSPFQAKFWIAKGYSEQEAEFNAKACRPVQKEYWLKRGYSEEEAVNKAKSNKDSNNKKGAKSSGNRPIADIRRVSHRCVEYWIDRGFSIEEATEKIKTLQAVGKLERFIERYGPKEGFEKWQKRQEKWQNTLKSKPLDEINAINGLKNPCMKKREETNGEVISRLKKQRNMDILPDLQTLVEKIKYDLQTHSDIKYSPVERYVSRIPKIQLQVLNISELELIKKIKHLFFKSNYLHIASKMQSHRMWHESGALLRSSYEIQFYERCKNVGIKFRRSDIDKKYPNSNFRFDFRMPDGTFIEICPRVLTDESMKKKIAHKVKTFGCIAIASLQEMDSFLQIYVNSYC